MTNDDTETYKFCYKFFYFAPKCRIHFTGRDASNKFKDGDVNKSTIDSVMRCLLKFFFSLVGSKFVRIRWCAPFVKIKEAHEICDVKRIHAAEY